MHREIAKIHRLAIAHAPRRSQCLPRLTIGDAPLRNILRGAPDAAQQFYFWKFFGNLILNPLRYCPCCLERSIRSQRNKIGDLRVAGADQCRDAPDAQFAVDDCFESAHGGLARHIGPGEDDGGMSRGNVVTDALRPAFNFLLRDRSGKHRVKKIAAQTFGGFVHRFGFGHFETERRRALFQH